jgi:hypothetical protein
MGPGGLLHSESPGIGQYVKELVIFFKAFFYAFIGPVRIHGNIMDCLHSGRIIVQYHNLMSVLPAFFFQ